MVRWGILGLGRAANSFANAIKEVNNAELVSTASLSKNKNSIFGKKFNISKDNQFKSYEELIESKSIDAIYIATLNNTHADLIIKTAKTNKGILCEKPIALNKDELKEIFNQLNKTKVLFLENIAFRAHPQTNEIVNQILNNEIGVIDRIESSFGFKVNQILKFKSGHRLFSKKLGGGAINDIGCYPVSLAVLVARLFQDKNKEISYDILDARSKKNFRGTDDESHLIISFHNLFKAELEVSVKKKLSKPTIIHGSKGKIIIYNPWLPNKESSIKLVSNHNNFIRNIQSKYTLYANTIKVASDQIQQKKYQCEFPKMTWDDSIICSKILSDWKEYFNEYNKHE